MRISKLKLLFVFLLFSLLTACASNKTLTGSTVQWHKQKQQINQIKHWSVKGKIAVTTPEEKFSSNYSWQHAPIHQELMLYGAFGNTYAHLIDKNQLATLTLSNKDVFQSDDVERLSEKILGYPFPIGKMQYWFKGLPHPENNGELEYDEFGYLKSINHEQWKISYRKYQRFKRFNQIMLPTKITITNGQITIKLSNRNWKIGTDL